MSNIILLLGISGSGKSTWAKKFLQDNPQCIYINADKMRLTITGDESNQDKNYQVFQTLEHMASYLMSLGKDLIIDNTNYNKKNRLIWNRLATAFNYNKEWIVFKTPLEQCILNNEKRERKVPIDVIKRQHENFTIPLDEGGKITYIDWNERG
jgi:predicted kinase